MTQVFDDGYEDALHDHEEEEEPEQAHVLLVAHLGDETLSHVLREEVETLRGVTGDLCISILPQKTTNGTFLVEENGQPLDRNLLLVGNVKKVVSLPAKLKVANVFLEIRPYNPQNEEQETEAVAAAAPELPPPAADADATQALIGDIRLSTGTMVEEEAREDDGPTQPLATEEEAEEVGGGEAAEEEEEKQGRDDESTMSDDLVGPQGLPQNEEVEMEEEEEQEALTEGVPGVGPGGEGEGLPGTDGGKGGVAAIPAVPAGAASGPVVEAYEGDTDTDDEGVAMEVDDGPQEEEATLPPPVPSSTGGNIPLEIQDTVDEETEDEEEEEDRGATMMEEAVHGEQQPLQPACEPSGTLVVGPSQDNEPEPPLAGAAAPSPQRASPRHSPARPSSSPQRVSGTTGCGIEEDKEGGGRPSSPTVAPTSSPRRQIQTQEKTLEEEASTVPEPLPAERVVVADHGEAELVATSSSIPNQPSEPLPGVQEGEGEGEASSTAKPVTDKAQPVPPIIAKASQRGRPKKKVAVEEEEAAAAESGGGGQAVSEKTPSTSQRGRKKKGTQPEPASEAPVAPVAAKTSTKQSRSKVAAEEKADAVKPAAVGAEGSGGGGRRGRQAGPVSEETPAQSSAPTRSTGGGSRKKQVVVEEEPAAADEKGQEETEQEPRAAVPRQGGRGKAKGSSEPEKEKPAGKKRGGGQAQEKPQAMIETPSEATTRRPRGKASDKVEEAPTTTASGRPSTRRGAAGSSRVDSQEKEETVAAESSSVGKGGKRGRKAVDASEEKPQEEEMEARPRRKAKTAPVAEEEEVEAAASKNTRKGGKKRASDTADVDEGSGPASRESVNLATSSSAHESSQSQGDGKKRARRSTTDSQSSSSQYQLREKEKVIRIAFSSAVTAKEKDPLNSIKNATEVEDIRQADYLVINLSDMKRSINLMGAINKGIPIVTTQWLNDSAKEGAVKPADTYIVKNTDVEKKHNFVIRKSLKAAQSHRVLEGYVVFVSEPAFTELLSMEDVRQVVECAGGKLITKVSDEAFLQEGENLLVLSTEKALKKADVAKEALEVASKAPNQEGQRVYDIKFLFDTAVKQKLVWGSDHVLKEGKGAARTGRGRSSKSS